MVHVIIDLQQVRTSADSVRDVLNSHTLSSQPTASGFQHVYPTPSTFFIITPFGRPPKMNTVSMSYSFYCSPPPSPLCTVILATSTQTDQASTEENAATRLRTIVPRVELDDPSKFKGALVLKTEKIIYCPVQKVRKTPARKIRAVKRVLLIFFISRRFWYARTFCAILLCCAGCIIHGDIVYTLGLSSSISGKR